MLKKEVRHLVQPQKLSGPQVALAANNCDLMVDKKCSHKEWREDGKEEPAGLVVYIAPSADSEAYSNRVAFEEPEKNDESLLEDENSADGIYVGQEGPQFDPWALPQISHDEGPKWKDLSAGERVWEVVRGYVLKCLALVLLLYLFICSLGLLSSSFRLLGGRAAGEVFRDSVLLQNPITGLMIGVLATVLLQSSSTSTSIVVSMVASHILEVRTAIPIIMGANIGTSMTNTLVSVAHSNQRAEFRRAFAGATVHDMFNWLCVICLLPLECSTGYLFYITDLVVKSLRLPTAKHKSPKLLKVLTEPLTRLIIQLDKKKIKAIALNQVKEDEADFSLIKRICRKHIETANSTDLQGNITITTMHCKHIFARTTLSDSTAGLILLLASLLVLIACLVLIVKLLHSMLKGQIASAIRKTINNDLPGCFSFLTGYVAIVVGAVMTVMVQSSSVFTSALTPLVGIGVLSLERMYPLTLGANVGTTFTSVLAALSSDEVASALQISFCHLFFNLSGILLFYVFPFSRKAPIGLAKLLGNKTAEYRWVAVVYVLLMFFLIPAAIFGLSVAGQGALFGVGIPVCAVLALAILVNIMQQQCPKALPPSLRSWNFLPDWMHSLKPIDRAISRALNACPAATGALACCGVKAVPKSGRPPLRNASSRYLLKTSPGGSKTGSCSRLASRSSSPSRMRAQLKSANTNV